LPFFVTEELVLEEKKEEGLAGVLTAGEAVGSVTITGETVGAVATAA
jgi:hypothetical protein